ncbi:MAG: twin-arginine translocation signal domain-containing protein, partial [Phycisphaerae bacterium]|nr:twin-arginine translocation signal domain-containing protein [Phycisphaerae bacterium]
MRRDTNEPADRTMLSRRGFLARSAATAAAGIIGTTAVRAAAQTTPGADRRIRMGVVGGGFGSCFPWH